ncbi:hypothetical protein KFU94_32065 [Chloroflexi bacterium TSY]|nr:hypothetical protein [Chloroflexi bacterium TSY]
MSYPNVRKKGRPPEYGDIVRPLSRCYRGKRLEATTPDSFGQFVYSGRLIRYQAWHNLVPRTTKVDTANRTYSIYVFQDPAYHTPLVLATVMALQAETIYLFSLERWPVEHPPLAYIVNLFMPMRLASAYLNWGCWLAIFFPI